MADLAKFTKQMQAMLPQWMKMAKDPNSVGAQFMNVFGIELDQVRIYLNSILGNQFIDTADIGQVDITYKVPIALPTVVDFSQITTVIGNTKGSQYPVRIVATLREFYSAALTESVGMLDRTNGLLYVRPQDSLITANLKQPFDTISVDGTVHYDFILHHIWNAFDEFGLLLGISRLYGERNPAFKARILDVFISPGGASKQGIINGLSRDLGLSKNFVHIQELNDSAFKDTLLNPDGSASKKLRAYAEQVNKVLSFTWDSMSWGDAYWRSISENNMGFDYLPHVWDASLGLWTDDQMQSGIGSGEDLLVTPPIKQSNLRNFNYSVGLRGKRKDGQLIYPEHAFKYKITAKGTILNQTSKPQSYKYTVVASEIIYLYFVIRAFQQYTHTDVLDFTNTTGIVYDSTTAPNLEIVTGSTFMSPKTNRYVEVQASLKTSDKKATPTLGSVTISWKDSANGPHALVFDTQVDFDRNDSTAITTKANTISIPSGDVVLGYGDFYHVINTKGDFNKGTTFNVDVLEEGTIRLTQPK